MKAILFCVAIFALFASEAFGQNCGALGGCNSGGQRQNNPGGRQAAPLIPPTSPDITNYPPPIVIPAKPLVPVPEAPAPQFVNAKPCECNNDELAKSLKDVANSLKQIRETISSDGDRLAALGAKASAPAGPAPINEDALAQAVANKLGLNKPQPDPTKPVHYVLVADLNNNFVELQNYVVAARAKFPQIAVLDSKQVPFEVIGGYPQLVSYDAQGHVLDVLKGTNPVERELGRIALK